MFDAQHLSQLNPDLQSQPNLRIGVGVNPICSIQLVGDGRLGNIADMIACGLSILVTLLLISRASKRQAAVGRVEFRFFLGLYLLSLVLQILTIGSAFSQASDTLVICTAIHLGVVAALFWTLVGNAFVSLQVVEDGTISSLVPFYFFGGAFFIGTAYVSLDTALGWTSAFRSQLKNIPLFVLTSVWPLAAAFIYFVVILWVVLGVLREKRPFLYYAASAVLFIISQVFYFLPSKAICTGSKAKVDGSFIATLLETASVVFLVLGWQSITEEGWDETNWQGP